MDGSHKAGEACALQGCKFFQAEPLRKETKRDIT